jgi:hypothetical protein
VAGVLLVAVDVLYLGVIASEGEGELTSSRVLFVAGSLGAAAAAALVGAWTRSQARRGLLLSLATAVVLSWGLLALLSIGILFVLLAIPLAVAAVGSLSALDTATAGSIAAAAVVVAVLDVAIAQTLTS